MESLSVFTVTAVIDDGFVVALLHLFFTVERQRIGCQSISHIGTHKGRIFKWYTCASTTTGLNLKNARNNFFHLLTMIVDFKFWPID